MSYHADESYDVYHEIRVFASKPHECDAVMCDQPIRKGDPYWRIQIVYDGRAETIKRCIRCQVIHEHLRGLGGGESWPDERLNCGQDYRDEWGRDPPADIQALAFWRPGEKLPATERCTDWPRLWSAANPVCYQYTRHSGVQARCVPVMLASRR